MHGMQSSAMPGRSIEALLCCTPGRQAAQGGCAADAGAFNMTTGPAHWELLQRARAIDNQLFVATCSPARNPDASYQAWGHSTVVSPWAQVRRCDCCKWLFHP